MFHSYDVTFTKTKNYETYKFIYTMGDYFWEGKLINTESEVVIVEFNSYKDELFDYQLAEIRIENEFEKTLFISKK